MSKEKEYIQELFTKPTETFSEHLELPDNERIIFSGRFGIGKSTFLNYYFKREKEKDKYNVIHLYPVNYSVLQNEDIFRYIKYDILLRLLTITPKGSNDQYEYSGFFDGLGSHIIENSHSLFSTFLLLIPELGEQLNQFSKELGQFWEDFEKAPKNESEESNQKINNFISDLHSKEGGIYETGEITQIIQNGLKKIKNGKKENILIIDDLDRIDPAHIFRILNVFSAHFDDRNDNSKNKFGFDRVILVCDIDNIRNIYAAMYGVNTDFNGYIDKFYSKEIYRYDNRENINNILSQIIDKIIVGRLKMDFQYNQFNAPIILRFLLGEFILQNLLNLRTVLKYYKKNIDLTEKLHKIKGVNTTENQAVVVLNILNKLFGDLRSVKSVINDLKILNIEENEYFRDHLGDIIYLLNNKQIKELPDGNHSLDIVIELKELKVNSSKNIEIKVKEFHFGQKKVVYSSEQMLSGPDYKKLLLQLVELAE